MKVVVFGSYGMAGHVVTTYLRSIGKHEVIDCDLHKLGPASHLIDVTDPNAVSVFLNDHKPDIIINCIGVLIQQSTTQPDLAIYLNSYFPHQLRRLSDMLGAKLIHMSTDCVFSGSKGSYRETDFKDGTGYYAQTKALGEVDTKNHLTFRTSIIGPELRENGSGLFDWFMRQRGEVNGFARTWWTGVTTLHLARAMERAIEVDLSGLYHLVPASKISKHEMLVLFNKIWNKGLVIKPDMNHENDKSLVNTRADFDFHLPGYETMFQELHDWMKQAPFPAYKKYFP